MHTKVHFRRAFSHTQPAYWQSLAPWLHQACSDVSDYLYPEHLLQTSNDHLSTPSAMMCTQNDQHVRCYDSYISVSGAHHFARRECHQLTTTQPLHRTILTDPAQELRQVLRPCSVCLVPRFCHASKSPAVASFNSPGLRLLSLHLIQTR